MIEKQKELNKLRDHLADIVKGEETIAYFQGLAKKEPHEIQEHLEARIEALEAEIQEYEDSQPPSHSCVVSFDCFDPEGCMYYKEDSGICKYCSFGGTCSNTLARANLCVLELKSMNLSAEQIKEMLK